MKLTLHYHLICNRESQQFSAESDIMRFVSEKVLWWQHGAYVGSSKMRSRETS